MPTPLPEKSIVRGMPPVKVMVSHKGRVFGQLSAAPTQNQTAAPVVPKNIGLTQALELVRLRGGDPEAARELIIKLPGVVTGTLGKNKTYSIPETVLAEFLDSQYPEEG